MSSDKDLIFVYGTLKQGWGNHYILKDQEYKGHAITLPDFQMYYLGGFPGVVEGEERITGEVYAVDQKALASCDCLEGHPSFYKREQISVILDDDEIVEAWIYIYQGSTENLKKVEGW